MRITPKILFIFLFLAATAVSLRLISPAAALPPRPSPPPTPAPPPPAGGLITLAAVAQSPLIPGELWTRVQWQDPQGNWREVDGWRGAFDNNLTVTWWVAPEDLNTGPFRWLVYANQSGGKAIAISEPFDLPPAPGQTTAVTVTLP